MGQSANLSLSGIRKLKNVCMCQLDFSPLDNRIVTDDITNHYHI